MLLTPGYWHENYWCESFWNDYYWPEYGRLGTEISDISKKIILDNSPFCKKIILIED